MVSNTGFRRPEGADACAFSLDLRLNWSRSIPMSCVEDIRLTIDGNTVARDTILLAQGGENLPLDSWRTRDDVWWPVLEPSTVTASAGDALEPGSHQIQIELRVRVPSFPPGPDGVWPTRFTRASVSADLR